MMRMRGQGSFMIISTWAIIWRNMAKMCIRDRKKRGFIMKNEDGTFTKTARFIAKYGHYGTPGVAA